MKNQNINKINNILHITELDLHDKKVLIRVDFNVIIEDNKIISDTRIQASIPTILFALQNNAKVILMSHLGRPKEGIYQEHFSLFPIVKYLKNILYQYNIYYTKDIDSIDINAGELILVENVRFNIGEKNNDISLSKKYAKICDIFVMDAFGSAHRKEASTFGVGFFSKIACAGLLLISELQALEKALQNPKRPMTAIVGGSKISTKFKLLESLSIIADTVIVGGGIANTFLAIENNIGNSLYEPKFIELAKKIKKKYNILIPVDSKVGKNFSKSEQAILKKPSEINKNEEIMDIGNHSIQNITKILKKSKTILWNGPVGVFEFPNFSLGTIELAKQISKSNAYSIAGGGETLSVIEKLQIKNKISYISTGGGAFLKFIEGKILPAIQMLELCKKKYLKK
ncbi:phosphoglycerate kinase [Buchnera aphidicola]|uniref:phosphoglycerate kinase n=1 Tax=Buchnera aphidicola TaxID=9 RepID=UPI0034649FB4